MDVVSIEIYGKPWQEAFSTRDALDGKRFIELCRFAMIGWKAAQRNERKRLMKVVEAIDRELYISDEINKP